MSRKSPDVKAENAFIGARIKARRGEMRMSQKDLGAAISVTFQQVQKYESGQDRTPSMRLIQIAEALRCDIGYFFGIDNRARKGLIAAQLVIVLESLGAHPDVVAIVGGYGDTLDDAEVASQLAEYNANGSVIKDDLVANRNKVN